MEGFIPLTDLLTEENNGVPLEYLGTPITESQPNQKHKGKNFNEDEDRLLVAAWLNISTDGIHGTNQTKAAFWTRVYLFYQNNRESLAERSQNSLLHRWMSIQEAVSKFCGYLVQIDAKNQSGTNIHDRVCIKIM